MENDLACDTLSTAFVMCITSALLWVVTKEGAFAGPICRCFVLNKQTNFNVRVQDQKSD